MTRRQLFATFFAAPLAALGAKKTLNFSRAAFHAGVDPAGSLDSVTGMFIRGSANSSLVCQEIVNRAAIKAGMVIPGESLSAAFNAHALKALGSIVAEWSAVGLPVNLHDPQAVKALRYALAAELASDFCYRGAQR